MRAARLNILRDIVEWGHKVAAGKVKAALNVATGGVVTAPGPYRLAGHNDLPPARRPTYNLLTRRTKLPPSARYSLSRYMLSGSPASDTEL